VLIRDDNISNRSQVDRTSYSVVAGIGLGQIRTFTAGGPVKFARVHAVRSIPGVNQVEVSGNKLDIGAIKDEDLRPRSSGSPCQLREGTVLWSKGK